MNNSITNVSPIALTNPSSETAARTIEDDSFREQLSFATHQTLAKSEPSTKDKEEKERSVDKKPATKEKPKSNEIEDKAEDTTKSTESVDDSKTEDVNDSQPVEETTEEEATDATDTLINELQILEPEPVSVPIDTGIPIEGDAPDASGIIASTTGQNLTNETGTVTDQNKLAGQLITEPLPEETEIHEPVIASENLTAEVAEGEIASEENADPVLVPVASETAVENTEETTSVNAAAEVESTTTSQDGNNEDSSQPKPQIPVTESLDSEGTSEAELAELLTSKAEAVTKATPAAVTEALPVNEPTTNNTTTETTPGSERNVVGQATVATAERTEAPASQSTSESGPRVDPSRFVSRVSRAFQSAQLRGGGPIEIRLSPPELGALQVRIEVKEGIMTATLETDNQAARNALLDNLPALRERLAEQQIQIEKFDVNVRDESNQSEQQQQQTNSESKREENDNQRQEALARQTNRAQQEIDTPEINITHSTIQLPEGSINVVA